MKSDLIDKAAKVIPHPPILINLVSRRVRQLNQGRAPLINTANYGARLGQGDIALLEIIEGLISAEMLNSEEQRGALRFPIGLTDRVEGFPCCFVALSPVHG